MNKEILMVVDAVSTEKDVPKGVIFEAPGDPYIPLGISRIRFLDLKIDGFGPKSVGILEK